MGIRTTVTASLGDDSTRVGLLHPLLYREDEAIQTRCIFNSLEFGGIKIWIIHGLPDSEELDGVLVAESLLYKWRGTYW